MYLLVFPCFAEEGARSVNEGFITFVFKHEFWSDLELTYLGVLLSLVNALDNFACFSCLECNSSFSSILEYALLIVVGCGLR
jgi:hypothetical protein